MESLKNFIENPTVNIVTAMILVITSLAEGWEYFSTDLSEFDLGVHHGVLIFGIVMLLRGILDALESVVQAHEKRQRMKQATANGDNNNMTDQK